MPNENMLGPATLSITQGMTLFIALLPKFSEVRKADPIVNPDIAADVRMGEIAACTLTISIGIMTTSLTGNAIPTYTAIITCGILVALYESTLRANRPLERIVNA
jgi:hypothetical protein